MRRLFSLLFFSVLCLFTVLSLSTPVSAATIKTGENVTLKQSETFQNLYSFGSDITSNASVAGDLVSAGGSIVIGGKISGSVMAAGGDILINGAVGNSARIAGGTVTVSGPIQGDLVVVGGAVTVDKTASIGGDILFSGGTLEVKGPVKGSIMLQGGSVILSSMVGGDVKGHARSLIIKDGTEVTGDLSYTSSQKAAISDGAIIRGQEIFHPSKKDANAKGLGSVIAQGLLFKLITDILFCLILVMLFSGLIHKVGAVARKNTFKNGLIGVGFIFLVPWIAIFSLLIIWLGLSIWLLYFTFLIITLMIGKILLGWVILSWWAKRNASEYKLDWKAAIVGPISLGILLIIPVFGVLAAISIYLITLGAMVQASGGLIDRRKLT